MQDPDGLIFLGRLAFCGHNLGDWWGWGPEMTVQRLETRVSLLLNVDGPAAEMLTAVQSGKSRLPEHRMQQLQVLNDACIMSAYFSTRPHATQLPMGSLRLR